MTRDRVGMVVDEELVQSGHRVVLDSGIEPLAHRSPPQVNGAARGCGPR